MILYITNYWIHFQSAKVQQLDPVYPLDATKEIEQKKAQTTKEKSISRSSEGLQRKYYTLFLSAVKYNKNDFVCVCV